MENEPQKAAYVYVRALQDMKEVDERYAERLRVAQRERLETIIAGAIAKKDYMSATKAIEAMNKMFGINEAEKKEVTIKESVIKFNFANDINNDDNENVSES
jgi:chorismate synthase